MAASGGRLCANLAVATSGSLLLAALLYQLSWGWRRKKLEELQAAPHASPSVPIFGNALHYKIDPAGFLARQRAQLGGVFRLNLAGLHMTVVSAKHEMAQVARASEALLSAKAATADFGFAETLGPFNVKFGTDLHRLVLKQRALADDDAGAAHATSLAVNAALAQPSGHIADALATIRRITLHAVVLHLVGEPVLRTYDFLTDFMALQDHIEDATAKGVALPSLAARLLVYLPVRRARERLSRKLARAIEAACASRERLGLWLEAVQSAETQAWRGNRTGITGPFTPDEAAQLVVGLLFAAHKNPAIGTAQTLLFLLEHPAELEKVLEELRGGGRSALRRSILEALRITAHTIGGIRKVVNVDGFKLAASDGRKFLVPFGEYVVLSHSLPNSDPEQFVDPHAFVPDRFLGSGELDEYVFTTFSQGLHKCPGRDYALTLMEGLLAELLRRFEFTVAATLPPLSYERATLAQRSGACALDYSLRR